jgi:hypothetical protein
MTLSEFLHPFGKATQKDLVLAVMYYLKSYELKESVTTADVAAAFTRAKHARGKKFQYASILNQAAPWVHSPGSSDGRVLWSLTETGERRIRDMLGLPTDRPEIEHDVATLRQLSHGVTDGVVKSYLDEGILCLSVNARRAAIVFLWSGAVAALRDQVWGYGAPAIEASLLRHNPKARIFKKRDDFAYVKDSELLQVALDLGVIDKTERDRLTEGLNLRNGSGHASKYEPGAHKTAAFVEDLISIVWS